MLNQLKSSLNGPTRCGVVSNFLNIVQNNIDIDDESNGEQIVKHLLLIHKFSKMTKWKMIVLSGRYIWKYLENDFGSLEDLAQDLGWQKRTIDYYKAIFLFVKDFPLAIMYKGSFSIIRDKLNSLRKFIRKEKREAEWDMKNALPEDPNWIIGNVE